MSNRPGTARERSRDFQSTRLTSPACPYHVGAENAEVLNRGSEHGGKLDCFEQTYTSLGSAGETTHSNANLGIG